MGRKKMKQVEKIDIRLRVDEPFHRLILKAAGKEQNTVAGFIRTVVAKELARREKEDKA
jgi:uncharacterized protein (DUF1778 family)